MKKNEGKEIRPLAGEPALKYERLYSAAIR